jgi:bifunctional DNA-binding transcriptional regulator/antitoxin component of YhaV-PrlF toxin-antitoxin module
MHDFFRLKIVSKRQLTIPQLMLEKLHMSAGDEFEVEVDGATIVAVRPLKLVPTDFFNDSMLRKLEERSKSMDAGIVAARPAAAAVRAPSFEDKFRVSAGSTAETAAEQEHEGTSTGGD